MDCSCDKMATENEMGGARCSCRMSFPIFYKSTSMGANNAQELVQQVHALAIVPRPRTRRSREILVAVGFVRKVCLHHACSAIPLFSREC